jgi:hypothetical protein
MAFYQISYTVTINGTERNSPKVPGPKLDLPLVIHITGKTFGFFQEPKSSLGTSSIGDRLQKGG